MASDNCTLLVAAPDKVSLPSHAELQTELENADVNRKISALKKAIQLLLSGDDSPRTLMSVIRYCITVESHTLQKLLTLYWEVARKYDAAGKLLPEMILVCNALRNNLIHPNEYIRGCTLRFLCKLREPEILEPLVPSMKTCLTHRHPYVRRHAVLAVHTVYRHTPELYPDACDDIEKVLEDETDSNTRRNAFTMIFSCAMDKALAFLSKNMERVLNFGDGFSLVLLDLIRKVGRADPGKKAKFIRIVFSLLDSHSSAVSFEAAGTLTSLSAAPSAVRAAAAAYIKILNKESDNNVKLIVLERLSQLRKRHAKTLRELVMDVLRALAAPNTDIRKKCLDIAMDLVYPRNVEEIMAVLKKEIISTGAGASAKSGGMDPEDAKYRNMLISAMHGCAVRFPDVAGNVVHLLMDFLNGEGALTVIEFVREIVETYPDMRKGVIAKLREVMPDVQASEVFRVALWLLGQYSQSDEEVHAALHTIRECIGPLPLTTTWPEFAASRVGHARSADAEAEAAKAAAAAPKRPVILADGTYASQSAATMTETAATRIDDDEVNLPALRKVLLGGDFFLGSVISSTLTKLALRVAEHHSRDSRHTKAAIVDAMLVMCAIVELGASGVAGTTVVLPASALPASTRRTSSNTASASAAGQRIDQDSFERIVMCMRVLGDPTSTSAALPVLLRSCRETFGTLLSERRARATQAAKEGVVTGGGAFAGLNTAAVAAAVAAAAESKGDLQNVVAAADDCLSLRLLRSNRGVAADEAVLDDDADFSKATAIGTESFSERLKRVHQLTGFADPVYCEAYMRVHEYDIVLELTVINRTTTTMTNVNVELATMGELRLVDRPQPFTLGPKDMRTVKVNIKVSSTETGNIFGTIVYDTPTSGSHPVVVNLAELHVDIMDYIQPATCSDSAFRSMWADFEWENKVAVNTNVRLQSFVTHVAKVTNMRILTPITALAGCNFLAANLYARSTFGEDALVNVSVENKPDGSIRGHIRIRAKTQGVALSLGDRITNKQKV